MDPVEFDTEEFYRRQDAEAKIERIADQLIEDEVLVNEFLDKYADAYEAFVFDRAKQIFNEAQNEY